MRASAAILNRRSDEHEKDEGIMELSTETMVEHMLASDATANGRFIVGVRTTKIYCLPSCRPPRKPKPENVTFYATIAEARAADLRACKLCKPDAFYADHGLEQIDPVQDKRAYLDTIMASPGPLAFAVNADGALLWLKFLDGEYARTLEEELAHEGYTVARDPARTARAREEIAAYCAGTRQAFDIPLIFGGSDWQNAVWRELTRIPFGETRTYGQIAARLNQPGAARAVGRANATNRLPLVVPCHRVLGANGSLTGFGGGMHLKTRLLAHEARVREQADRLEMVR